MANIYVKSGAAGAADGSTWADAFVTLTAGLAVATAADTIWVSNNHAESTAGAVTLTCPTTPGLRILCGDDAAEPPTALATTATVTTTGNNAIQINGNAYIYGITFSSGTGNSGGSDPLIGTSAAIQSLVFDNCQIASLSTNAAAPIVIGGTATAGNSEHTVAFLNTSFKFGATGHSLTCRYGRLYFQNISIDATGATPTTLFITGTSGQAPDIFVESSDLSGEAFTNLVNNAGVTHGRFVIRNSKLPASITVATGTIPGAGAVQVKMHNCDSGDTNYRIAEHSYEGTTVQETTIVPSGGASDGTTALSWKMVSSASTLFFDPLVSPEISSEWIETTGGALTATVEFVHDSLTNLQDDEIWLEIDYLGTSGVPKGTRGSDRMANILSTPADQTDSAVSWTTTGLTNPNTQKLVVNFTPQEKGPILARVMLAKPSTTVYVGPKVTIA